jgi:CPA1 family monovalent cation:H+ antiporter
VALAIGPLLVLLLIAVVVVIVARRIRVPYTVALVVLGFAIGLFGSAIGFSPLAASVRTLFTPGVFFDLLLPPIIFEAALHVRFRWLRRRAGLILSLVFIGVVFITLFTGFLVAYLTALPLVAALLLAAILSPTDPVAVIDLFRRLRVPQELTTIVETESLLNDAVGVILFVVLLGVIATGTASPLRIAGQFVLLTFGGIGIGLAVAGAVYVLHRQLRDPAVETAISVVAAYGSFLLATYAGASGIIACAISGIAVGTWVAPRAIDRQAQHAMSVFWNIIVYIANSIIFLAMGLLFAVERLIDYLGLIVLVAVVVLLGRIAFVYAHRPLSRPGGARLPDTWYDVIALSGIRGAIPVVLALSLLAMPSVLAPSTLNAIVASVLGVAFVSIVAGNILAERYVTRAFPPVPESPPGESEAD